MADPEFVGTGSTNASQVSQATVSALLANIWGFTEEMATYGEDPKTGKYAKDRNAPDSFFLNLGESGGKVIPPNFKGPIGIGTPQANSLNQALSSIAQLPENEMLTWKNMMYDAGLYPKSMYSQGIKPRQLGVLTTEDRSAFQDLFTTALLTPGAVTAQEIIQKMSKDKTNSYSKQNNYGNAPKTVTVQTSDPATIRGYINTTAQELLGRSIDDKTANAIVQKLIKQEAGSAISTANAQAEEATTNRVITSQNVDVAARTAEEIEAQNPAEAEAKRFATNFDAFMGMITGGK